MPLFKLWIKTRKGHDRFEFVIAKNEEEVKRAYEGTLKSREKIECVTEA